MTTFGECKGHRFLALGVRMYLAGVFLVACAHKIASPTAFAIDIATYQIVPLSLVNLMALVLPWVELLAGFLLLIGWRTQAAAFLITLMMAIFTLAVSIALYKGLNMSCGCFASQGANDDPISWRTIVRDTTWFALGLYVLFFDRHPLGLDALLPWWSNRSIQKGTSL
jgi:putative oxidoreductase